MKKGRGNSEHGTGWGRLVLALVAAVAMATGAWAEPTGPVVPEPDPAGGDGNWRDRSPVRGDNTRSFVAYNTRVEQRFPWNDYVDVRFSIKTVRTIAKSTNIIARVRGFYDGQMMLDMDHLYLAQADGSPDLSRQFVGGDVFLEVDESGVFRQDGLKPNDVRLVWDAAKDVPPEAEKIKTLHVTVELEPMTKDVEVKCHNGIMVGEAHGIGEGSNVTAKVVSFLGIPFAHPPTNDVNEAGNVTHIRRWKAPEWAPTNWEARIEAKRFAPSPIQQFALDEASSTTRRSEDCLYLNIWTGYTDDEKPIKGDEQKPVLVFIHGGSFCQGGTKEQLYDCRFLAEKYGKDVVFVTIEYRLNLLAQFDFTGLAGWKEEDYPDHGRLCFKDQQMALRWLKANVAGFGGDPDRITISGESAGGVAVTYMTAKYNYDENGKPLFQRAIPMSGAVGSNSRADYTNANHAAVLTEAFRQLNNANEGFDTIDDFQKATEQELVAALMWPLEKIRAKGIQATPQLLSENKFVIDLHMMPLAEGREGDPDSTKYAASGTNIFDAVATTANVVDLLTGDTGNESRYWADCMYQRPSAGHPDNAFGFFYDNYLPMKLDHDREFAYTLPGGGNAIDCYIEQGKSKDSPFHEPDDDDPSLNFGFGDLWCKTELLTELQFRMPQIRLAENFLTNAAVVKTGKKCYMYSFEKERVLPAKPWARALHASELPYFFRQPYFTDYGPLNRGLMDRVSEFFIEFVKTGIPKFREKDGNGQEVLDAPAYDTMDRKTVAIRDVRYKRGKDETVDVVNDPCTIEVVDDPKRERRELMMPVSVNLPPGI